MLPGKGWNSVCQGQGKIMYLPKGIEEWRKKERGRELVHFLLSLLFTLPIFIPSFFTL
jgi:hypothetical protein